MNPALASTRTFSAGTSLLDLLRQAIPIKTLNVDIDTCIPS